VKADPSFAQADARIAEAHALFAEWGWSSPGIPADSQIALGFTAVNRALKLDSTLADGWMARGLLLYMRYPRTLNGAVEALRRATVLDSTNAEAWHQYGSQVMILGQYERSIELEKRALALEPGRAITWENLGDAYELLHRPAESMAAHDSALAADPQFVLSYAMRCWSLLRQGDRAGARANAEAALRSSSPTERYYALAPRAAVAAADGDSALGRALMAEAVAPFASRPLGPLAAQMIIYGFVATGQRREALDWLERVTPRGVLLWWTLQFPGADPLRPEPRFQKVLNESQPTS
jgi:tetratricopeptide (TPR) repeat protein